MKNFEISYYYNEELERGILYDTVNCYSISLESRIQAASLKNIEVFLNKFNTTQIDNNDSNILAIVTEDGEEDTTIFVNLPGSISKSIGFQVEENDKQDLLYYFNYILNTGNDINVINPFSNSYITIQMHGHYFVLNDRAALVHLLERFFLSLKSTEIFD